MSKLIMLCRVIIVLLAVVSVSTQAGESIAHQLSNLKTFEGQPVPLHKDKLTHLIFQDAWASYEGHGEEARVANLPEPFLGASEQVWVQPGLNITEAQLREYQGYFPQVTPLVLDRGFRLMRSLDGWDLPMHVLLKDGQPVFSGSGAAFERYTQNNFSTASAFTLWLNSSLESVSARVSDKVEEVFISLATSKHEQYSPPLVGDRAPEFTSTTMSGDKVSLQRWLAKKPVSVVFIDSLCPMPQFPGCEAKLEQLNQQVAKDTSRQWLGVVSSYYVNEDFVREFKSKFELSLPLVFDRDNTIYQAYDVHATPYRIDIAQSGQIQSRGDVIQ